MQFLTSAGISLLSVFYLSLSLLVPSFTSAALIAEYKLSQCECSVSGPFSSSVSANSAFQLLPTSLAVCPTTEKFDFPTSQGIVLNISQQSFSDVGASSSSGNEFSLSYSNGISVEHWIRPLDLISDGTRTRSMVLSELRSDSQIFPNLPNFHCSVAHNPSPSKARELQVHVGSEILFEYTRFSFPDAVPVGEIDPERDYQIICGIERNGNELRPYACVDGVCEVDDSFGEDFDQDFAPNTALIIGRSQNIILGSETANIQILTVSIHTDSVIPSSSILEHQPVLQSSFNFEATEETLSNVFGPQPSFLAYDGSESVTVLFTEILSQVGNLNGIVEDDEILLTALDTVDFTGAIDVYTSADGVCEGENEFVKAFEIEVFVPTLPATCQLPSMEVNVCITEVNDLPVAATLTVEVPDLEPPNQAPFNFEPGTDVDDIVLNGQVAVGGLLTSDLSSMTLKDLSNLNGDLFTFDGENCGTTPLVSEGSVLLNDGNISLCFEKDNENVVDSSFTFTVTDASGEESLNTGTATLDFVQFLVTCAPESCVASTNEEQGTLLQLIGSNSVGGEVLFRITSLPSHGTLFRDAGQTSEITGPSDLLPGISTVFYVPDNKYFNTAPGGGSIDGLGQSICPGGVSGPCPDEIGFQIESGGATDTDTFFVEVVAVDNVEISVNIPQPLTVTPGVETIVDGVSVNSGADEDAHEIEFDISSTGGVEVFISSSFALGITTVQTTCSDNSFCSEPRTIIGYPSAVNKLLDEMEVRQSTSGAEGTIVFEVSDSISSDSAVFSIIAENAESSSLPIVPIAGAGLGLLVVGAGVFFFYRRRSRETLSQGHESDLEVNLYSDADIDAKVGPTKGLERKKRNPKREKPAPPTDRKESVDPDLVAEDEAIEAEIAAENNNIDGDL